MSLLTIGKNSKNIFHHKNLAFEQEGNGGQNGTIMAFPQHAFFNSESYTSDEDIGVDDDFNHRSVIEVQELKNGFGWKHEIRSHVGCG